MSSGSASSRSPATALWRRATRRVRSHAWAVVQQSAAAGVAWVLADRLGSDGPAFFAPIAAVVALNTTLGVRGRQAVNLLTGTLVGIVVGAGALWLLGSQGLALVLATLVAMLVAVATGGARVAIAQAAAGAILTVTIPYGGQGGLNRLLDALLGVAVALVFSHLFFATHPLRLLARAEHAVTLHLHELLTLTADVMATDGTEDDQGAVRVALASTRDALAELDSARSASISIVHHTLRGPRLHRQTHARVAANASLEEAATAGMLVATTGLAAPADVQSALAPVVQDAARAVPVLQEPAENPWTAVAHRAEEVLDALHGVRSRLPPGEPATDAALGAVHVLLTALRRPAG